MQTRDALSFWNSRANLGKAAGSNDLIAKQLEIEAILSYVRPGMRILDFGCGNGVTAVELARRFSVDVVGVDYSSEMVSAAKKLSESTNTIGTLSFRVGDAATLSSMETGFDLIYTERMIINLKSWEEQRAAIEALLGKLNEGGHYVMFENSEDGLNSINELRACLDLKPISPPWHNRYLREAEVTSISASNIRLVKVKHYSSTYYLLSRVLNAALAEIENRQPEYDAPINKLALKLPPLGAWGQGKIWLWKRA